MPYHDHAKAAKLFTPTGEPENLDQSHGSEPGGDGLASLGAGTLPKTISDLTMVEQTSIEPPPRAAKMKAPVTGDD